MRQLADIKSKLCDKPIIIDDWQQDDTYEGVYPKGARDKSAYFSPATVKEVCLKTNHRYLFKLSRSWCLWQFWGEIIAYRLGLIMGVEVPPAQIGISKKYNPGQTVYGALIEWFYDDTKDVYVEGGQFMIELIKGYDRQRGTQHNFSTIAKAFFNKRKLPRLNAAHWAGIFTLDCLTGNTDRHQDNWGLICKDAKLGEPKDVLFSPAFDNGTALGYEIIEKNIDRYNDPAKIYAYLTNPKRARHHMKWSIEEEGLNFYNFMQKFALEFLGTKSIIEKHLDFSRAQVEDIINPLLIAVSDNAYCLSKKRLHFIMELIFKRKELLERTLGL